MARKELVFLDDLTGVYSRRYLREVKHSLIPALIAKKVPFTIAISDLDHFKEINDIYGHAKGDEVIRFFATFLKNNLRSEDIVIRYGGDEFVVVQKGLRGKDAHVIWERLIGKLKATEHEGIKLSMSVGIASYPDDGDCFSVLFDIADANLYQAKRSGRGKVGLLDEKRIRIPPVRFVDRTKAVDRLLKNIEKGRITLVSGEAGCGKTRLIKEVLSGLREKEILWSDCLALERKISYYPIRELVKYKLKRGGKDFLANIPPAYRIEIGKIVPEVMPDDISKLEDLYGKMLDRYRLFEGLSLFFNAGERPKVVVIDNIQWADEDSLEALKYILRNKKEKDAFIFSMRKEEESYHVKEFFQELSREHGLDEVALLPLEDFYMREIVRVIVGDTVPSLEDFVVKKSSGNVFYAEELIRTLSDNGFLVFEDGMWNFVEPEEDIAPRGIEDITKRKFDRLSQKGKEIARILSVARKGYIDLLIDLSGFDEDEVLELVEEGIKAGLFMEGKEEDTVVFRSELLREVVYRDEVSKLKKKRFHKKIAEWLEKHKREGNEEELAYHYMRAGAGEKAVEYGILAARKSIALYASREALRYYKWVQGILQMHSDRESRRKYVSVLLEEAGILEDMGKTDAALGALNEALRIIEESGFIEEKIRALDSKGMLLWRSGRVKEAIKTINEAIRLCREHNFKDRLSGAYNNLGILHTAIGDFKKAVEFYEEALRAGAENSGMRGRVYNNLGLLYNYMENVEDAERYFLKAKEIFKNGGNKRGYMITIANLGLLYANKGEYLKAIEYYNEALRESEEVGDILATVNILDNMGVVYIRMRELDKAEEYLNKALKMVKKLGDARVIGNIYNNLGLLYDLQGEYVKALEFYEKSYEIAKKNLEKRSMVIRGTNVAGIYMALSKYEEAEKQLREVYSVVEGLNIKGLLLMVINSFLTYFIETQKYTEALEFLKKGEELALTQKGSVKFDFMLNKLRVLFKMGRFEEAENLVSALKKEITKENIEWKIDLFLVLIEYYLSRKMLDEARRCALTIQEDIIEHYDKFKKGLYFLYRWQIEKLSGKEQAYLWYKKAKEVFDSLGLLEKFEKKVKEVEK